VRTLEKVFKDDIWAVLKRGPLDIYQMTMTCNGRVKKREKGRRKRKKKEKNSKNKNGNCLDYNGGEIH